MDADEQDLGHGGGHCGLLGVEDAGEGDGRRTPPTSWAATNGATDAGAIPAKVSLKTRPTVTAGLAKQVDEVNQ